jgi:iron complex outermembrane receptor protein
MDIEDVQIMKKPFQLRLRLYLLWLVSGILVPAASLAGQQTGTIRGTVISSATGQPLAHVVVVLEATGAEAKSDDNGQFTLEGITPGEVRLRLELPPDYVSSIEQVPIRPGVITRVSFEMTPEAVILDELLVRGRPARTDAIVRSFRPGEVKNLIGGGTAVDLIAYSFSGVQVVRGSGQAGSGSRILIRGINSLTQPGDPIIYVDGVRVGEGPVSAEGREANYILGFLDMIPAETIARIEVLKGPSASRYGVGSSNGVILIFTR